MSVSKLENGNRILSYHIHTIQSYHRPIHTIHRVSTLIPGNQRNLENKFRDKSGNLRKMPQARENLGKLMSPRTKVIGSPHSLPRHIKIG